MSKNNYRVPNGKSVRSTGVTAQIPQPQGNDNNKEGLYAFRPLNERVHITPMKALFCERVMKRFAREMNGLILPNQCFLNSMLAANWLIEQGFDIRVVEGVTEENERSQDFAKKYGLAPKSSNHPRLNSAPIEHCFLVKGDKYFDPTIEGLFGMEMVRTFDYTCQRIYVLDTFVRYFKDYSEHYGRIHFHSTISGLSYFYDGDKDIPIYWGHIDDNGNAVYPTSNPFMKLNELCKSSNLINY